MYSVIDIIARYQCIWWTAWTVCVRALFLLDKYITIRFKTCSCRNKIVDCINIIFIRFRFNCRIISMILSISTLDKRAQTRSSKALPIMQIKDVNYFAKQSCTRLLAFKIYNPSINGSLGIYGIHIESNSL